MLEADFEMLDHSFYVNVYRLGLHISLLPEGLYRLASLNSFPVDFKTLHEVAQGPNHLAEHRAQVLSGILGVVDFNAKI